MKKTLISVALTMTFIGSAYAQQGRAPNPAAISNVAGTQSGQATLQVTAPVQSSGQLQPSGAPANPFTGVSKAREESDRSLADLQAQSQISQQKLKLQRDELDALRLELEKRKVIDQLTPPAPPKPAPAPVVKKKPVKEVKPVEIIGPKQSKNERPEVLGVIESGGQRIALIQHDGKSLRAQIGSVVAGKGITQITGNSVQWGGEYLSVSGQNAVASIAITDTETPASRKQTNTNPGPAAIMTPPPVAPPQGPRVAPVLNPQGATINSSGAGNPSGIFNTLPPPPPTIKSR